MPRVLSLGQMLPSAPMGAPAVSELSALSQKMVLSEHGGCLMGRWPFMLYNVAFRFDAHLVHIFTVHVTFHACIFAS